MPHVPGYPAAGCLAIRYDDAWGSTPGSRPRLLGIEHRDRPGRAWEPPKGGCTPEHRSCFDAAKQHLRRLTTLTLDNSRTWDEIGWVYYGHDNPRSRIYVVVYRGGGRLDYFDHHETAEAARGGWVHAEDFHWGWQSVARRAVEMADEIVRAHTAGGRPRSH